MKIISVIIAKSESKDIPNKNIRILNGKPLIYYSIKNAIESKFINKVIVLTDSKEVSTIAKQIGVKVKCLDSNMFKNNSTLDSLVYNVSKEYETDIVVAMQSNSATLKKETLDVAIEYFIKNNLDTLISVVKKPLFSWKYGLNNNIIKNKVKLDIQNSPNNCLETGAFLISKKNILTEKSIVGNNVEVYEIGNNEGIDIENLIDLKICEYIMKDEKVAFYVNGNTERGTGHIYRCLELADEFYIKPDIYFDINQTDIKLFGATTHNLIGVNSIFELFEKVKEKKYNIIINDILNTNIDYMIALKSCCNSLKIINFEDDGEGIVKADLVINSAYSDSLVPHMKTGKDFYICPKIFMVYEKININEKVENVIISFGGADPQNYTDRLLEIIKLNEYRNINFKVILGRAKKNKDKLMEYNKCSNIEVLYNIKNMPEVMSKCDIAISSRGRTGYELALLGIPTISIAQNKREEHHDFMSNENGFEYIGLNPSNKVIKNSLDLLLNLSKEERQQKQNKLLSNDLKNGRKRVFDLINSL